MVAAALSAAPVTTRPISAIIPFKALLDIGVADAGAKACPLDISGLTVFSLTWTARSSKVTDPSPALISGNCADIGKLKGPIVRGLAARAPYFHNGSAATLQNVVDFL